MTRNEKIGYTTVFTALFAGAAFFIAGPVVALAAAFCVPMLSFLINKFQNRKRIVVPATVEETNTAIADASAPTTEKSPKNNNTAAPTVEPTSKAIETPAKTIETPAKEPAPVTTPEPVVSPVVAPTTPTKPTEPKAEEPVKEVSEPVKAVTPPPSPKAKTEEQPPVQKEEPKPENPEPAAKPAETAKGETPPAPNADKDDPIKKQKELEASRMNKGNSAANPPKQDKPVELTDAQRKQIELAAKRAASNNLGAEPAPKVAPASPFKMVADAAGNAYQAVVTFFGAKAGEGQLKRGNAGPTSKVLQPLTSPEEPKKTETTNEKIEATPLNVSANDETHPTPIKVQGPAEQRVVITEGIPAPKQQPVIEQYVAALDAVITTQAPAQDTAPPQTVTQQPSVQAIAQPTEPAANPAPAEAITPTAENIKKKRESLVSLIAVMTASIGKDKKFDSAWKDKRLTETAQYTPTGKASSPYLALTEYTPNEQSAAVTLNAKKAELEQLEQQELDIKLKARRKSISS